MIRPASHASCAPLTLEACQHLPGFPRFLRQVQTLDVSTSERFEANYPRICRDLGGSVTPDLDLADRTKLPPVGLMPKLYRMDYRPLGDRFVGRGDDFWRLHDALYGHGTAVISAEAVIAGTGGLGKTQLAVEYAWRFAPAYPGGVFWVAADQGLPALVAQVAEAAAIALDAKADDETRLSQLWHGLNRLAGASLLVLDNFPEDEPLRSYLPVGARVHTLITTRRQDLGCPSIRLDTLSIAEGLRLLNSGSRRFGDEAAELVRRLGGLPLALELARAYLNYRRSVTLADLLAELDRSSEIALLREFAAQYRDQLHTGHDADIVRTFQLSWEAAPERARAVLRVMAELAPVGVPRALLREVLELPETAGLHDPLGEALDELLRLSLVELDAAASPLAHRLVLAFARYRNEADSASPFEGCLAALQAELERASLDENAATMRRLEPLVPHGEWLLSRGRLRAADSSGLAGRLGTHFEALGRYADARRAMTAALESAQRAFEPGHPRIATGQSNLALVLKDLGQLEEARDLLREALASDQKTYEPGHPRIATGQSNLATVLRALGQLEEARDLLGEALASDQKTFEPGHPSIATRQSNLAMVLSDLGQWEEARELLGEALASDQKTFEPGHPSIAIRQSNLALVLKDLGRLEEARELLREALASDQKTFEPGHPSIAIDQSNLAMVLQDLGQLEEARDLLREALASAQKTFEPGHPSIATRQSNLALVLSDLGRLEEARELLRQAHRTYLARFGPEHPGTRTIRQNLDSVGDSAAASS